MTQFDLGRSFDGADEELEVAMGRSRQRSRIHILSGPRAGEMVAEVHDMTAWTSDRWRSAICRSAFTEVATYDGGHVDDWPRVEPTVTGGLLWHELEHAPRAVLTR